MMIIWKNRQRLLIVTSVVAGGCILIGLYYATRKPALPHWTSKLDHEAILKARVSQNSLNEAIKLLSNLAWNEQPDTSVVAAISVCRNSADTRANDALVTAITYCTPPDPERDLFYGDPDPRIHFPAIRAIVEEGERMIPSLVQALVLSDRTSSREYFLLSAFGAILGPHKGVKVLETAGAKAATSERTRLTYLLIEFRNRHSIPRLTREEGKQAFSGSIYNALKPEPAK